MHSMHVRIAEGKDFTFLTEYDRHVSRMELQSAIALGRVIVAEEGQRLIGWLRWNLFWDNTPFMNLLFLLDDYRGQGYGKTMVAFWEKRMREAGYRLVMTSTQSDEGAQRFYRRLHYTDAGALLLPGEPLEILFVKELC